MSIRATSFFMSTLGDYPPMSRKPKKQSFMSEVQSSTAFHIQPKNEKQNFLLESIEHNPMTVCIGPAGTGKTFCAGMKCAQLFLKGKHDKIILSRANVPTGKSLGYFPGTVQEKMTPWLLPMMDVLTEGLGKGRYEYMMTKGQIEIQPIETIRGRSFENALVIVDEAQNLRMEEIKAVTTRLGENSKLIMLGDPAQSDVHDGDDLIDFVTMCERHGIEIPIVRFGVNDIVRSDIVASLVKMFLRESV